MTKRKAILSVAGVIVGLMLAPRTVDATWPTTFPSLRTISSQMCTGALGQYASVTCPFPSDSADYWGGACNGLYADFQQTHNSGWVAGSACRQSWTGSAVACGTPSTSTQSGPVDMFIEGFETITGGASVYDYFYVSLQSWADSINLIWGTGYTG